MPLKALLWDMDGTLCDTDVVHFEIFQDIMKPFGHIVDHKFYKERISGRHNQELFKELLPSHYSDKEIDDFASNKEAIFRDYIANRNSVQPLQGLTTLLQEAIDNGIPNVCVTNAPRLNAEFMLENLKLNQYFKHVIIGDECTRAKPFPDPYLEAMKFLGVNSDECVVFEDSASGIKAAVAANVKVVGVATTQTHEFLKSVGATVAVDHFNDVNLAFLQKLVDNKQ